jgi:hypothetical protein
MIIGVSLKSWASVRAIAGRAGILTPEVPPAERAAAHRPGWRDVVADRRRAQA